VLPIIVFVFVVSFAVGRLALLLHHPAVKVATHHLLNDPCVLLGFFLRR
jgi:hypothetical protein